MSRTLPQLSRADVAQSISDGRILFIHKDRVIDASKWANHHPGGALAILHFVGRDATDEVEAYHSSTALARLERYACATVAPCSLPWRPLTPPIALGLVYDGQWRREGAVRGADHVDVKEALSPADLEPKLEPLDAKREEARSTAYRELRERIKAAGYFTPPDALSGYGSDILRYLFLGGMAFGLHLKTSSWAGQMASAVFLGLFYHQLTFLAHDAGHTGVTGDYWKDRVIGMVVANWIGGLSLGWWCDNHNIHHLVTNHPEHDPDIQHIPFFAITKDFFGGLWSTYYKRVMPFDAFSRAMIGLQHRLYFVVLSLARFNLYANSYTFLLFKAKRNAFWRFEMMGIAFFWTYYGAILYSLPLKMRIAYLLVSHIVTSPVHVQITLSHFACSTEDLGPTESFASRQLRTTMDVICSPLIEFMHGGLHLQVTHHLFPRLPRHNLRKASLLVKQYCVEQDVVYREHGFIEGNTQVISVLREVAQQLKFLKTVAEAEVVEKLR